MFQSVQPPTPPRVEIRGLPVFEGSLLTPSHPALTSLHSIDDCLSFARQLRGQFSLIIRRQTDTLAITDFGGSLPVFYTAAPGSGEFQVFSALSEAPTSGSADLSAPAAFSLVARGGIGAVPAAPGIHALYPATVATFQGRELRTVTYIDWASMLRESPISAADAVAEFNRIASSYLSAVLSGTPRVACLLSGGTDSALVASLLLSLGKEVAALTADYSWQRYSEAQDARRHASILGLPSEVVVVNHRSHRNAFRALNTRRGNAPCSHAQSPSLACLARKAADLGITHLVTGDHADSLFLGFDSLFKGLPPTTSGYLAAVESLSPADKLARLYPAQALDPRDIGLLEALNLSPDSCRQWLASLSATDRDQILPLADEYSLPVLQQLNGQRWAGISWQNIFLPVSLALNRTVEFVSPFYDIEMVRFALSLPLGLKYRDGETKPVLRDALAQATGIRAPKRASPNPSRIWSLYPDLRVRRLLPRAILQHFDRLYARNLLNSGSLWTHLNKTAAIGLWLSGSS